MRQALASMLSLLALVGPVWVHSATLPDYRTDAKKVYLRACDAGATRIMMYRSPGYYVTEAITRSGYAFIMLYAYAGGGEAHFYVQSPESSHRAEVSRSRWYDQIERISPNYFKHVRGIPGSDCYVAEEYF
jgi:hypothetical protein